MKPFLLKVLSLRTLVPFAVAVLVVSIAASTTGLLLVGASSTVTSVAGGGNSIIVVFSGSSKLPETSVVPIALARNISNLQGVASVSPETLSPVSANGRVVFLRGVILADLELVDSLTLTAGSSGPLTNDTLLVGNELAHYLGLREGSRITLDALMTNYNNTFTVAGVFSSSSPLDDELIANLSVGQEMRGIGSSEASLIRVKVNPAVFEAVSLEKALLPAGGTGATNVSESLTNEALSSGLVNIGSYLTGNPSQAVGVVLSRAVGLSESALWSLVAVVSLCSSLSLYYSLAWVAGENSGTFAVLQTVGMSEKSVRTRFSALALAVAAPLSAVGFASSFVLSQYLSGAIGLEVLFQGILITPSPEILLVSVGSVLALTLVAGFKVEVSKRIESAIATE